MDHSHKNRTLRENEFILCTGLPGRRHITREDCGRRHLLARKEIQKFSGAELDLDKASSLEICSTCLEGSINAGICEEKHLS